MQSRHSWSAFLVAATAVRRFFCETLLVRALRDLAKRPHRGALWLYSTVGAVALIPLATPFSRAVDEQLIAVHHYRPKSWPSWLILQLTPKMYSFEHTCWIGSSPLFEREPRSDAEFRFLHERFWVNHYPARRARFDSGRERLGLGTQRFVYIRTTYFGVTETTGFQVSVEPGKLRWRQRQVAP